jgi:iron complex outermembrane recepter protein
MIMKHVLLAVSVSMLAIAASPVLAQDVPAEEDVATDGDIIVTATRETTLLSKTPIAITAIDSDGLRDSGITDSRALNDLVPNLRITENGDAVRISIRGVTSSDTISNASKCCAARRERSMAATRRRA